MPPIARQTIAKVFICACAVPLLTLGCQTGADVAGDGEATREEVVLTEAQQIHRLEVVLGLTGDELETQNMRVVELGEQVSTLQRTIAELEAETVGLQDQYGESNVARDAEIELLKTEREALLRDMERLANAAEVAAAQAAQAIAARSEAAAISADDQSAEVGGASSEAAAPTASAPTASASQAALTNALGGLGGFRRVEDLGFQSDARLGSRLAVTGSGLAVDSTGEEPVLFDVNLSLDSSLVYLTIADPAGRDPRLVLTVQYVSDVRPLYAQTAFISIQGSDPIDPVDPVIFTGSPKRETDGVRVREAFSREVDRQLLNRISTMLSSSAFTSSFVGTVGRDSHRPSTAEREAMSRVLFAYIDLGGYR